MTETKNAPKWKHKPVHGEANRVLILDGAGTGNWVAEIRFNGEFTHDKQKEFSDTIAAAPELLAACEMFAAWLKHDDQGPQYPEGTTRDTPGNESIWRAWWDEGLSLCKSAQEKAASAIAKATGQAA